MARPFFDWKEFLEEWSAEIMQLLREYQQYGLIDLEAQAIARNSLAYLSATDEQIKALETRLGVTLPPSYVEFLKTTNGWIQIAMDAGDGKIWSSDEVQWYREQAPEEIVAWMDDVGIEISDEEYFVYGKKQDCVNLRTKYLKTALAISAEIDTAVYLLNPQVVMEDGEWEAWFLGHKLPGADRYKSFREMMQAEKTRVIENLREGLEFRAYSK